MYIFIYIVVGYRMRFKDSFVSERKRYRNKMNHNNNNIVANNGHRTTYWIYCFIYTLSLSFRCSVAGVASAAAAATSHQNRLHISHKLSFVSHSFIHRYVGCNHFRCVSNNQPKMNIYVEPRKIATTKHMDIHTHIEWEKFYTIVQTHIKCHLVTVEILWTRLCNCYKWIISSFALYVY